MDPVAAFNVVEAALWIILAALAALLGHRVRGLTPRLRFSLALSLFAFGVSDLVEVRTGAWWRPPGLLIYKGLCLLGIVASALLLWRNRRGEPRTP